MPVRGQKDEPKEKVQSRERVVGNPEEGKYKDILDLSFLPRDILARVDDIFDSYFGLGMKPSNNIMERSYTPQFPSDMASLSSPELGNRLGEYTAWYAYASDKLKYIVVACNHIEGEMDRVIDKELGTMVADKGNIEAKKSKAKSSTDYITLISYHQKLSGMKILLDSELKSYDKCIASLSREVSRREFNGGF